MPLEMMSCPHCGTKNSANKRVCYHCRRELQAADTPGVARRTLRPKSSAAETSARRPLQASSRTAAAGAQAQASPRPTKGRAGLSMAAGASLKQRVQFYRQMYSLLNAGIPVGLALNYIENNIAHHLRPAMRALAEEVQKGNLLSEQMTRFPNLFPEWECSVVKAAEVSGTLPQAMDTIAATLEIEMDLRHRVSSHTWGLKATAVVFVLVLFIVLGVGRYAGDAQAVFLHVARCFLYTGGVVLGVLIAARLWQLAGRTRAGGSIVFAISSRVPIIGPLMKNLMRIRFIRTLETMWRAGVGPMEAVETAARASGSHFVLERVRASHATLGEGGTLADLLETTRILPQEGMYIIRAGEASGSIPEALAKVAEYLGFELDAQVKTLPTKVQMLFYAVIVPAVFILMLWFYVGRYRAMGILD